MRRLTEPAVLAVLALRAWLEGQAERRFTLVTASAETWVDDAQLERVLQVVQLRVRLRPDVPPADQMAEAWNAHDLLPSVGQARVEVEAGRRTLVLVGADLRALSVAVSATPVSTRDYLASLAARAALFLLPGGRPTRAAR